MMRHQIDIIYTTIDLESSYYEIPSSNIPTPHLSHYLINLPHKYTHLFPFKALEPQYNNPLYITRWLSLHTPRPLYRRATLYSPRVFSGTTSAGGGYAFSPRRAAITHRWNFDLFRSKRLYTHTPAAAGRSSSVFRGLRYLF